MEQDFNRQASVLFDLKRKKFYESIHHEDINSFMYAFGVNLRSFHHEFKEFGIVTPYAPIFKKYWDLDIWTKVTWGADDKKEEDIYEQEFEYALKEGLHVNDYMIIKAVKNNRPAWAIYGLIGMMQGYLNANQFEREKHEKWNKEDFIRCMNYLPLQFLKEFREDIIYLFNYFDERGTELFIDLDCHEIFLFEKQVPFDKKKSLHVNKGMFSFFDGVKLFENLFTYDNWLSSIDYSVWKDSYVEIDNEKLFIIRDNVKVLSTFRFYDNIDLEIIAKKYELIIKEENGVYYAYAPNHNSRQLEISENSGLVAIYSLDGNRAPESIFIYGVFKSDNLNTL